MGVLSELNAKHLYTSTDNIVKGFPSTHFQLDCDNVVIKKDEVVAFLFTEKYKRKKMYYFADIDNMISKFGASETETCVSIKFILY